ncbi:MAG: protein-tyrosine kinase [Lachnospiraceae bacterium]|nr:protein-tyrosine kinase [Lachnospiraceae bacterium]
METTNKNEEIEIDLREIFAVLLDKIAIIILVALIGASIAFIYTKFMISPTYRSSTGIYVTNNQQTDSEQINVGSLQSSSYLTKDYMVLAKSRPVLEAVIDELKLNISTEGLLGMLSVSTTTDTRIITISVTSTDPWKAKSIADAVREAAIEQITRVVGVDTVQKIDDANTPKNPIGPNLKLNVLIGFLVGFVVTVIIVLARYMLDDSIKVQEDVEKYLGISVLGTIPLTETPDSKKKKKKKKIVR